MNLYELISGYFIVSINVFSTLKMFSIPVKPVLKKVKDLSLE